MEWQAEKPLRHVAARAVIVDVALDHADNVGCVTAYRRYHGTEDLEKIRLVLPHCTVVSVDVQVAVKAVPRCACWQVMVVLDALEDAAELVVAVITTLSVSTVGDTVPIAWEYCNSPPAAVTGYAADVIPVTPARQHGSRGVDDGRAAQSSATGVYGKRQLCFAATERGSNLSLTMYAKKLRISWRSTPVTDPKRAIRALPRQMIVL